jgi:hypothetical protein
MTWDHVSDIVGTHRCHERQRYGKCNCRTGKGAKAYNPCQVAVDLMTEAESLGRGEAGNVEGLQKFLHRKTCARSKRGRMCNHRGCIAKEEALDFIQAETRKKAV